MSQYTPVDWIACIGPEYGIRASRLEEAVLTISVLSCECKYHAFKRNEDECPHSIAKHALRAIEGDD